MYGFVMARIDTQLGWGHLLHYHKSPLQLNVRKQQ